MPARECKYLMSSYGFPDVFMIRLGSEDSEANVTVGSLAALHSDNTRTAASGCKAAIRWQVFQTLFLNVRFHQKRSFNLRQIYENEGLLSAKSGH